MKVFARNKVISTLFVVLVLVSTTTLGVGASPVVQAPQAPKSMPGGPPVILRAVSTPAAFRTPPPRQFSQLRVQSATITVNYLAGGTKDVYDTDCYDWPTNAKTAFDYAVSIWASLINSTVPIRINACWAELETGVLGYGATDEYFTDFTNAPVASTWYPVALANALSGTDLNGTDPDMHLAYSRTFNWYYGTDGNPGSSQYDFASVVLHEICHGLGFAGSMRVDNGTGSPECNGTSGVGCWGGGTGMPITYDRFTVNLAHQSLIDTGIFPNPSAALGSELTSGNVYFKGSNAEAANGGLRVPLYAPSTWTPGSSYSHLAEIFDGTPNALMTYALDTEEANHSPGPIAMGLLKDLGWGWGQEPDVSIRKQVVGGQNLQPGDTIKFTLTIANIGTDVATNVVVTDNMPSEVLAPTVQSTLAITATGATNYVWDVEPLSAGETGVITISGQIDPALNPGFAFNNTATISASGDNTSGNNSSTVNVGTCEIYLPLLIHCWPQLPYLLPISNPDGDGFYTVSWSWPSCAPTPSSYELQADSDPLFGNPTTFSVTGTSFDAYGPSPGTHYWRVRASGASQWSNVQSVTVGAFSYVFVDNDTGGTLTVEIVGVASQSFPAGFDDYWRSVPVGTYTIRVQAQCGSLTDSVTFPLGAFTLRYWCGYASLSTSMESLDRLEIQSGPPTVTKAPDAIY